MNRKLRDDPIIVLGTQHSGASAIAEVLHRNENDVAASLSASANKGLGIKPDKEFWVDLYRQYIARAREYGLRHKHYFEFHYEDFCWRPVKVTKEIFDKLDLIFTEAIEQFLKKKYQYTQD